MIRQVLGATSVGLSMAVGEGMCRVVLIRGGRRRQYAD